MHPVNCITVYKYSIYILLRLLCSLGTTIFTHPETAILDTFHGTVQRQFQHFDIIVVTEASYVLNGTCTTSGTTSGA